MRKILGQQARVLAVQFEQTQAILFAQRPQSKKWRSGIDLQAAARIQSANQRHVVGHGRRMILSLPQAADPLAILGELAGVR